MNAGPLRLVRVERHRLDHAAWYGFVAGETEQLVVFHYISDRYDLDGYRCVRRADLSLVEEDFPRRDLVVRALRLKELEPSKPPIRVEASMREMMHAVDREFGLVTIHRELVAPDECEIGQIRRHSPSTYVLRWLDPSAVWSADNRPFRYADVTRVDFGGEYERTLLLVARDRESPSTSD